MVKYFYLIRLKAKMYTNDLKAGDKVYLISFGNTDVIYRRRLLALGLTCKSEITIVRIAPLGCPLQIIIRGTDLMIRKEEAEYLQWEYV